MELLIAPELVIAPGSGLSLANADFKCLNMAPQGLCWRNAKDEIHPRRTAKIQHLWCAIVAVRAEQDINPWPMAADLLDQTPQKATQLNTRRAFGRAQHGRNRPARRIKHDNRLEAVIIVIGIEQPQLLPAMHGIKRVINIKRDAPRHRAKTIAVEFHHGARHADQCAGIGRILKSGERGLRTERTIIRQPTIGQLEHRIVAQAIGIVAILIRRRDHQQPKAQHLRNAMPDAFRRAQIPQAGGQSARHAKPRLNLTKRQKPAIRGHVPAVKAGNQRLARNR